jgi:hypothetical protein
MKYGEKGMESFIFLCYNDDEEDDDDDEEREKKELRDGIISHFQ